MDEEGRFNAKKFLEYSSLLGLPPIANEQIFRETLGLAGKDELSFEQFAQVLQKQ